MGRLDSSEHAVAHGAAGGDDGVPPPPYREVSGATDPLLGVRGGGFAGAAGSVATDIEDDFRSDMLVRMLFVRKIYTILFVQLLATSLVSTLFFTSTSVRVWMHANSWTLILALLGSLGVMLAIFWKRKSYPANLYLLGAFTMLEAYTIGNVVTYYDAVVVLQALVITLAIFLGLTLFTFQTKYDFTGIAPYLFGGLWFLIFAGFMAMFFPFSRTFDLFYAIIASLIFSAYIIVDTQLIIKHLNYDEYIVGALSLYLDVINLFLQILRIINQVNSDN